MRVFIAATLAGAVASVLVCARLLNGAPVVPPRSMTVLVVLAGLLLVAELQPVRWLRLHDGGEITPSFAFGVAIVALPAPLIAIAVHAAASAISDVLSRKRVDRILFNVAQTTLSLAAGAIVLIAIGEIDSLRTEDELSLVWLAASIACGLTVLLANAALTCTVLALHEGTSVMGMLRRGMFVNIVGDGILVALAPVFVIVAQRSVFLLFSIVAIAAVVHFNTKKVLAAEHDAQHDGLTELWNRRTFTERVQAELDLRPRTSAGALMVIDVDGFKEINDRLGHQVGDEFLVEIGRRLRALKASTFVGRLGGDEFAMLITRQMSNHELSKLADSVRLALSRSVTISGFPVAATVSVGVAMWPDHGLNLKALLEAADLAMYTAKRNGDAVAFHRASETVANAGRLGLLADLEVALLEQELTLWYQPQVRADTGEVVTVEALLRWHHPRYGLVSPAEFMPLAEQTELVYPITCRVLDLALHDALGWNRSFPGVRVAVNASARNLHDLGFPKIVADALTRHRAKASILDLEITENAVVAHPERATAVLDEIRQLGITLSIDDFGTGYSSLGRLKNLHVNTIKIDRSFIRDLETDTDDQAIVKSVIDLARNLGLNTVAEGVEDQGARTRLRNWGCDVLQGYHIARPMPVDQLRSWMNQHQHRLVASAAAP